MIAAIDIGGDRLSYGFQLIMNSIKAKFGDIVAYIPNKTISKTNFSDYPIILCSFMFVENYFDFEPTLKKMRVELNPEKRKEFIIVGGSPVSENPFPIARYIDIAVFGEGEWVILDILRIISKNKGNKISLKEISEIDCCLVPSINSEFSKIKVRQENINRAFDIPGTYTRPRKSNRSTIEYILEYHRGCKRKCKFCSYAYLQNPYREANKEILHQKIIDISKKDPSRYNSIVLIQTNLFHVDLETIELIASLGLLPNYSPACVADIYAKRSQEILKFLGRKKNKIYLRFGVEDFTEEGRANLGKPISDNQLINLPFVLPHGEFKLLFISHLPWQSVEHVKHFETVLDKMAKNCTTETAIDMYITALNCKLNTYFNYPVSFNEEVYLYLNNKFKRRYGKLTISVFKNQGVEYFERVNKLSLTGRV